MDAAVDFDPFRGGEVARTAPTTEPQREVITSALLSDEANTAFNEAVSLRIRGPLEAAAVDAALRVVVSRHDALRMTFTRRGDELTVADGADFALETMSLVGTDAKAQETRIRELWNELVGSPMDLFHGPLFRALWLQLDRDQSELILLAHHVICDGWSFYVILDELSSILAGKPLGDAPSFADVAEQQHASVASNADADYWTAKFERLPPILDLPTDRPRPAFRTFAAERVDHVFDTDLTRALTVTAGKLKASVVNVALAGTGILLNRLAETNDLAIGLPVARQSAENMQALVGHGVQLLPIRLQFESDASFSSVVSLVKTAVLDAREHYNFTFGTLIRELGLSGDPARVPLTPVIFNIDQPFDEIKFGDAAASVRTVPRVAENFEIFLNVLPAKDRLVVEATFNSDLYSRETIECWLGALESLLRDATRNPDKAVSALRFSNGMPPIYAKINATERAQYAQTWLQKLEATVADRPDAVAVIGGDEQLTFAQLWSKARKLAGVLQVEGVGKGSAVGIYMTRSAALPVVMAAVHMTGAAYVPLDPSFPEARLRFMVESSGARVVVTDLELPSVLRDLDLSFVRLPDAFERSAEATLPKVAADEIAYVIYTSGSTGQPKGVEVPHGAVANFLASMALRPGMTEEDTLLAVTTLSFDISVLELLLPLTTGGRVVVATRDDTGDGQRLMGLLTRHEVTMMQATPATWRLLFGQGWPGDSKLRALCGGEALPIDLAATMASKVGEVWNMYGPTETTVWSTCKKIEAGDARITVGPPIDNTQIYVMDAHRQPLPPGIPGELWIGGAGVARGYHAREDLTKDRFVRFDDFGRLYRTGDRARILPRGDLEHLGRLDDQVKVRGFRIELAEIEAVLVEHPDLRRVAVHLWTVKSDDVRIVACCVPTTPGKLAPIGLRKHLRSRLPEYMIPQHFLAVDDIPLTPNGKVDRRRLPVPVVTESQLGKHQAPTDPTEAVIADIWTKLVHPDRPIGRNDRFFEMGGHSLLGLEALRQIEDRLKLRLNPRVLFLDTLADIALKCKEGSGAADTSGSGRPVALPKGAERLLSTNQERVFREWAKVPSTLQYHLPASFKLVGELDLTAFTAALKAVFTRHSALRTVVQETARGLRQKFLTVDEACVLRLSDVSERSDPQAAATTLVSADVDTPMDLHAGPVVALRLIRTGRSSHLFFVMPHLLVFDGWSFDIILKELTQNYAALERKKPIARKPLEIEYSDYTTWRRQQADADKDVAAHWQRLLDKLPAPIDWPGKARGEGPALEYAPFVVPRPRMAAYEEYCAKHGTKLQTLVLSAFARAVANAFDRRDLFVFMANSGRFLPDVAGLIGLFYSNMPTRLRLAEVGSDKALIDAVQASIEESNGFQDVSLDRLTEIAGSPSSMRPQVSFSFQEAKNRLMKCGSLEMQQVDVPRPDVESDLELWVRNTGVGMVGSFDFRAGIMNRAAVESLRDGFLGALDRLTGQAGGGSAAAHG